VGKLLALGVAIGGLSCVFNLYIHTYQQKGCKEATKIILDSLPFYGVIFLPLLYIQWYLEFYKDNKWIILGNIYLLFARITIDIQVKILTQDGVLVAM